VDTAGQNVFGKRVLVELSHAVEQFALAARPGDPLVVVALFQKAAYFGREEAVYRDIAGRGAVTVVGLAEDVAPRLPPGVRCTLFPGGDELAREWSVTVLGPRGGATLVATDLESVDPDAATLEAGRRFRAGWSFRRVDAYGEVLRLRSRLRLPDDLREEIDGVLHAVLAQPEPTHQDWWDVPLRFLAGRTAVSVDERTRATAVLRFCEMACAGISRLDQVYPFVALPAAAAATVTRSRALPLGELRERAAQQLAELVAEPAEV
jgi:hypothetical protein